MIRSADTFLINEMRTLEGGEIVAKHQLLVDDSKDNNFPFNFKCAHCPLKIRYERTRTKKTIAILKDGDFH